MTTRVCSEQSSSALPASIAWVPMRSRKLDADKLRRKAHIKAVLLNQKVFSGVGNIYADEALFRAGIRPTARNISRLKAARLLACDR